MADKDIATAVRFIREHSNNGISVEDVVAAVPLSRITLERKFTKVSVAHQKWKSAVCRSKTSWIC